MRPTCSAPCPELTGAQYEEHLAGCRTGASAVAAELAGMPGLLGQRARHEVIAMGSVRSGATEVAARAAVPAIAQARLPPLAPRGRGTRPLARAPAAAAAAALVIGGLGGYALSSVGRADPAPTDGHDRCAPAAGVLARRALLHDGGVDLVPSGSGTQLRVECQYAPTDPNGYDPQGAWAQYSIWVVDRRGKAVQEKTWTARPSKVMRPTAQSPLALGEIAAVEIRRVDTGETVMRAGRV